MILDPLLIFGYLGFPAMGTNGAALATTLSQLLVFSIFSYQLYTHRSPLGKLSVHFKKHKKKISQIARLGTPVSVQNMIFATLSTTLAQLAARFGHVGVAVFSIGSQIEAISWMTAGGFSTALGSFVGQNFGAKKYGRIVKGYQISMLLAGGIGLAAGLAFFLCRRYDILVICNRTRNIPRRRRVSAYPGTFASFHGDGNRHSRSFQRTGAYIYSRIVKHSSQCLPHSYGIRVSHVRHIRRDRDMVEHHDQQHSERNDSYSVVLLCYYP